MTTSPLHKLVIIEPMDLLRDGLCAVINDQPDMEVVAGAGSVVKGIAAVLQARPSMVLLNLHLPDGSGLDVLSAVRSSLPHLKVVALTVNDDDSLLFKAIEKGVRGYFRHSTPLDFLLQALRQVGLGGAVFPPDITVRIINELNRQRNRMIHPLVQTLSSRELEVLCLMSQGVSNQEIGSQLGIVESTVKNHVHRILTKLSLRNRREAYHFVREHGINLYM